MSEPTLEELAQRLLQYMRRTGQMFGHCVTRDPVRKARILTELGMTEPQAVQALKCLCDRKYVVQILALPPGRRANNDDWKHTRYVLNPASNHRRGGSARKAPKGVKRRPQRIPRPARPTAATPLVAVAAPVAQRRVAVTTPPARVAVDINADLEYYVSQALAALRSLPGTGGGVWLNVGEVPCTRIIQGAVPNVSGQQARDLTQWLRAIGALMTCSQGCSHVNTSPNAIDVSLLR